jgi:large subunit ribosomal protein L30
LASGDRVARGPAVPARLRVTLVKSPVSHTARTRSTVRALGLHRIGQTVEIADTPQLRGMTRSVRYLLATEELGAEEKVAHKRRTPKAEAGHSTTEPATTGEPAADRPTAEQPPSTDEPAAKSRAKARPARPKAAARGARARKEESDS